VEHIVAEESALISGLLASTEITSLKALVYKEPTKFVAKICVNSKCNRVY
jgi:hypothetical protein